MASEAPKPSPSSAESPTPGGVLAPQRAAGRGHAGGRAEQDVDDAVRPSTAAPSSSGTPIARSATAEPPRLPTASEEPKRSPASALSAMPAESWLQVCEPVPVSPRRGAPQDMDDAGVGRRPDVLVGHADHQLDRRAWSCRGCRRRASRRSGRRPRGRRRPRSRPASTAGCPSRSGRSRSRRARGPRRAPSFSPGAPIARSAKPSPLKLPTASDAAEIVAVLGGVGDPDRVLRPELRARRADPGRAARQHVDGARGRRSP